MIIKSTAAYHFTETNAKCTCRLFRHTNCKFAFACSHPLPRVPQFFFVFRENTCYNIILISFKLLSILISHLYRKRHVCTSILCKHDFINIWIYLAFLISCLNFKAALTVSCIAMNGDTQLKLIKRCVLTSQLHRYFSLNLDLHNFQHLHCIPLVLVPLISKANTLKSCFAVFILCKKFECFYNTCNVGLVH